jgi:hypothetical protein
LSTLPKAGEQNLCVLKEPADFSKLSDRSFLSYVAGLLDTDGSLMVFFKKSGTKFKYRPAPQATLNQVDPDGFLFKPMAERLNAMGIKCRYAKTKEKDTQVRALNSRADKLIIESAKNIARLFQLMDQHGVILMNAQRRNRFIMEKLIDMIQSGAHNTLEGRKKFIDLRYNLACSSADQDIEVVSPNSARTTRAEIETQQGLEVGSTIKAAKAEKIAIDKACNNAIEEIERQLEQGVSEVDPYYLTGVIEGDGSFKSNLLDTVRLQLELCVHPTSSLPQLGDERFAPGEPYPQHSRGDKLGTPYCRWFDWRIMSEIVYHFDKYPCFTGKKYTYERFKIWYKLIENRCIKTKEDFVQCLKWHYSYSPSHGAEDRRRDLSLILDLVEKGELKIPQKPPSWLD